MTLKKFFPQLTTVFVLSAIVGFYHEAKAIEKLAGVTQSITSLAKDLAKSLQITVQVNLPSTGAPGTQSPGAPKRREDAGTRNKCPRLSEQERRLTALVPDPNIHETNTISERPTFWFYIPYRSEDVYLGRFILSDKNQNTIYERDVELPEEPGIIGLYLPETFILSEEEYIWYFAIDCSAKSTDHAFVKGMFKRLQLDTETGTPQQQLNFYADNGLWYELITTLAEEQGDDWIKLLELVGLGDLAEKPIQFRRTLEP